jgi:HJR/Mrr/RecB family endonuclease
MQTFIDLMIIAAKFLVGLWPVMFITVLVGIGKRHKGFGEAIRTSFKGLIISWGLFAVLRLVFYMMKMETFHLVAEPTDTYLFVSVGLLLFPFMIALLLEEKRKRFNASTLEELRSLSPSEFEELVAETYRAQGHQVQLVGGTGDHGIDLIVNSQRRETWLVQCKRYRGKIGEPIVRDFYGALKASDADGGAIITTGTISDAARLWAEGKPIKLYDGDQFLKIVIATRVRKSLPVEAKSGPKSARRAAVQTVVTVAPPVASMQPAYATAQVNAFPTANTHRVNHSVVETIAPVQTAVSEEPDTDKHPFMSANEPPSCPACNVPMILTTEKRFLRKPRQVYICPNAPECSESYPVEE